MVFEVGFGGNKMVSISTHGWFTVWAISPEGGNAYRIGEMLSAGTVNEIGINYSLEMDEIDWDGEENRLPVIEQQLINYMADETRRHREKVSKFKAVRDKRKNNEMLRANGNEIEIVQAVEWRINPNYSN